MVDVVRVQGGNPCDIRLAVRPEFSDKYTKMVQKYSRFFTKNYAIGPSVPPKFVNFASLSQKEMATNRTKKEIDTNTKRDQRPTQIASWRLSIAPINNAQSTYVMTQFVIKNLSLTNDRRPHPRTVLRRSPNSN
jgi:hypothetical protein